jgi:hypothetical protein
MGCVTRGPLRPSTRAHAYSGTTSEGVPETILRPTGGWRAHDGRGSASVRADYPLAHQLAGRRRRRGRAPLRSAPPGAAPHRRPRHGARTTRSHARSGSPRQRSLSGASSTERGKPTGQLARRATTACSILAGLRQPGRHATSTPLRGRSRTLPRRRRRNHPHSPDGDRYRNRMQDDDSIQQPAWCQRGEDHGH